MIRRRTGIRTAIRIVIQAFRALAAIVEMASELAGASVVLLDGGFRYASGGLIRQLIDTEYLLAAFAVDFSKATSWARATPEEIRQSFSPAKMRVIGGFSNREYWRHCDVGGHPAPSGRVLLKHNMATDVSEDEFLSASVWVDLAQHLRRLWSAVDRLLCDQHARYERVRRSERESVDKISELCLKIDPLATSADFRLLD